MSHYLAKILKEEDNFIFQFPELDAGSTTLAEVSVHITEWIRENQIKIKNNSQFFVRLNDDLVKIQ